MNETQTDMLSSKRDLLKQIVGAGMKPAHEERGHQHAAVRLNCQDFSTYQEVKVLDEQKSIFKKYKVENPYFRVNESVTRDETVIGNKSYVSFSSYNYLGLSGTEAISKAAKQAWVRSCDPPMIIAVTWLLMISVRTSLRAVNVSLNVFPAFRLPRSMILIFSFTLKSW